MPEPFEFRLALAIRDRMKAIDVADGYYHTITDVASKLDPDVDPAALVPAGGPRPFCLLELPLDGDEEFRYQSAGSMRIVWPFIVHVVHTADATDDESRMKTHFRNCADVEKAFGANLSLGGLIAEGAVTVTRRKLAGLAEGSEGSEVWSEIHGRVYFERLFGTP
jgi:hypothetical protein